MPHKKSTLSYSWMEHVWNEGREEAIDEMMDKNVVFYGLGEGEEKGIAAFKKFFRNFRAQFPEIHVDVQDVISEEDFETSRCVVNATSAAGQKVNFTGITIVRLVHGKIVEGWNNFDFLSMYQQLGYKMTAPDEQPA